MIKKRAAVLKKFDETNHKLEELEAAKDQALHVAIEKIAMKYRKPKMKLLNIGANYANNNKQLIAAIVSSCQSAGLDGVTTASLLKRTADVK